jgi:ATP-dependent helicase/DNAse subunit B
MTQITFITGWTQSQRQAHIWQLLRNKTTGEILPPQYLYLVPTQRKINYTREYLLKQRGKDWLPPVYTLHQLANELYLKLGGDKRLINEFSQQLILKSLLTQPDANWEFFDPEQLTPGLLKGIARFIAQAKTDSRNSLADAIRQYRSDFSLQAKDRDLLKLFNDYQQLLTRKSLIDPQGILIEVTRRLEDKNGLCRPLQRFTSLVIDGFYYFTPVEQEFIKAVIKIFERVVVSIDCNNPPTNQDHPLLTQYLDFWRVMGADPGHTLTPAPPPAGATPVDQDFLAIGQRLFRQAAASVPISSSKLIIRSLPRRREEVRAIARDIRQIVSQHPGISLAHIYVVFPQMEIYAPLIQEIFPCYGISYEITKGYPLRSSSVARVILRFLAIKLNGYQREDWRALFASELVDYRCRIEPDNWADFVDGLDIKPAVARQLRSRLLAGEQQLNMPLIDYWARRANLQGGASWEKDWLKPLLKVIRLSRINGEQQAELYYQLYILRQAWTELEGRLPAKLTSRQFVRGLLHLIRRFRVPQNIINKLGRINHNSKRDELIILRREFKALDKLQSLLKEMDSSLGLTGNKGAPLPLSELYAIFLNCSNTEEYHPTDHTEDRVQVVETLELRGLSFEYLFWGGLSEEGFPRPEPRELFYPPISHRRLFALLPRLDEDRYLFSYIFKNTRRRITLSYPLSDQGKPLLPSAVIEELRQVAAIGTIEPVSCPMPCYTRQELLCCIAADLNKGLLPLSMLKALKRLDSKAYYQLLHLLELDSLRQSSAGFSPYEGILASPASLARIKQLNPDAHYAVTQLEDYALCPMSYFFKYILRLTPAEEIVEDFQPQDRGSLLHKILEDFYCRRIEKYSHRPEQIRITPANLEEASRQMLLSAERMLGRFYTKYHNLFWRNEKQGLLAGLDAGKQQPPSLLRAFLEHEAQSGDRLIPRYIEFRFGQQGAAPALKLGDLSLEGRVDRVDLALDNKLAVVYDYKFGSVPANSLIQQGLSFQLPVYMLAVADFLKKQGYKIGAGGYYQLLSPYDIKKTNYFGREDIRVSRQNKLDSSKILVSGQRSYGFLSADEFKQKLEEVQARILHVHQMITRGRFHPFLDTVAECPYRFCDYARICRVDPVRLAKMYPQLSDQEHYKPQKK